MSEAASPKDEFLTSLERCTESEEFVPAFYRRFMSTSEEVRRKFQTTDFEQQNKMLVRSLRLVAAATAGDHEGMRELRQRAETHDREHLDIRPELYDLWLASVIATAREYDRLWSDAVESAWRRTLQYAIDYMVRRY